MFYRCNSTEKYNDLQSGNHKMGSILCLDFDRFSKSKSLDHIKDILQRQKGILIE